MSALARAHDAVNLGQGFPDDRGPEALRAAAAAYVVDGHNQYPPMMGLPALRQAVAEHDRRTYGLDLDWQTEVLITSGATEALLDCFLGLLEAGDEVVLLEPAYDTYAPVIRRLGAVPVAVRLTPPDWWCSTRR
jgi:N-succinyldiaminopimelate aminotransferase